MAEPRTALPAPNTTSSGVWLGPRKGKLTRGLRFRLTLSYVLFFTILLSLLGLLFLQTLASIYDKQVRDLLSEEWAAVKGYLRVEKEKPDWFYDREDPEEEFIVSRLRRVFLLTNANGKVLEVSDQYREIGIETPEQIRAALRSREPQWHARKNADGVPYLVRSGWLIDDNHKTYYVAIARSLAEQNRIVEQFRLNYFLILPVMILSCSLLGWFVSGRALQPVNALAQRAERITSSNLNVQIPERGANDELDRLIASFNQMIERLDSSFTQAKQFSTDVSHELRTPLTAIRGQLEVALFTARTTEQYREAMVNALQDVERLSQTIRALLLLSQAESGQLALQKQPVDLAGLAADIVDQFQIPADGARVELTAEIESPCRIEADRIQIERLVSNLLSNAVKYTPAEGKVKVEVKAAGGLACVVVEDTGVGIAPDHLPHIFDRFYRVPGLEPNPERGLGLGLSFVAWIARAHGGRVEVESTAGQGSRFTVWLPQGQVESARHEAAPATVASEKG